MTLNGLHRAMAALPLTYPGPGGAVAVLRAGEVLGRHAWGWADLEQRIAFTPETLFRICSISKQFTCGLLLDRFPDPSVLDDDVRHMLPLLEGEAPRLAHLANNQSGLRDYWATAMLCGSPIEALFGDAEANRLIGLTSTLHFAPGTRYSYCNQNFRMIGDIIQARCGEPYAELLRKKIFDTAGMPTARLCADTSAMPDGAIGYEGTLESGFRPAVNRISWTGDAGIGASLDDMIAWERFIDSTRDDSGSLYRKLSVPQTFEGGAPARYGFGVSQEELLGRSGTGHGGGLRGWRSFRFYLPGERISIVVLFNHMADPRAASLDLLRQLVEAPPKVVPATMGTDWTGSFLELETGLAVRLETTLDRRVKLYFGSSPEILDLASADEAAAGLTRLRRTAEGVWMDRAGENQSSLLRPVEGETLRDVTGRFHCAELQADFTCVSAGDVLYGAFSGWLGQGMMQILVPVATDLWRLPMPRALDHAAPGDWTLQFHRNGAGGVTGLQVGCWLARRIRFERVG